MGQPQTSNETTTANRRVNMGCLLPLIMFLILASAFVLGAIYESRQVRLAEKQYRGYRQKTAHP
jgi:hypothetical protein